MAVQSGNSYQGISTMLIERMSEIRDTYQAARKKRLQQEKEAGPNNAPKLTSGTGYRYTYKSGQKSYNKKNKIQ